MLIKSFCVGNKEKSYYIDEFSKGINIIHSDDNDKGKTILSQGILYSLGNTPCFPSGFDDFKEYYFITEILKDDVTYLICRKKDSILVKRNDTLYSFDSINEFKRYFSSNIQSLPIIKNTGYDSLVGLELFLELFFMPQDNRTTSNIFNRGRYNKDDYIDMICALNGVDEDTPIENIEALKVQIKELEERRKVVSKSLKILRNKNFEVKYSSYMLSKEITDKKIKLLEKLQSEYVELINKKNKLFNKKSKNEILLKEINSIKRNCEEGKLFCLNCGSENIAYETSNPQINFEVADFDTRKNIINIIVERIKIVEEDLTDLDDRITSKRKQINELLKDESLNIENYLYYKNEIMKVQQFDSEIHNIDKSLEKLRNTLKEIKNASSENKITKKQTIEQFVQLMNRFYKTINPEDPLVIDNIFTRSDINYSGSQGVLYIMARYYAVAKMMSYDFPIIIDDFRDGEISTVKEAKILSVLNNLDKQIILTCTLKEEENIKYDSIDYINDISFDRVEKFHLLNEHYNVKFREQLYKFYINLNIQ